MVPENGGKSNEFWIKAMGKKNDHPEYALCVENRDWEDLDKRKIYQILYDEKAQKEGYLRVLDESGEDYLYPASYFIPVQLPVEALDVLRLPV